MSDDQPDPIREIRTELINHADPIVQQAYEYIVDLELAHAKRGDDHAAEVERLRAVQKAFVRDNRDKTNAVRELEAKVERLEASVERTARAFRACKQAREDAAALHRAEVERLTDQRDWHRVRNDALQKAQRHMRDPERKVVCDILANGTTYVEPFRAALEEA